MSSILKALRKLEEEKRVASHAAPDLRVDQGGTPQKAGSLLPLLISGIFLVIACSAFLIIWQSSDDSEVIVDAQPEPPATVVSSKQEQQVVAVVRHEKDADSSSSKLTTQTTTSLKQTVNVNDQPVSGSEVAPSKKIYASKQPQPVDTNIQKEITGIPSVVSKAKPEPIKSQEVENVVDSSEALKAPLQVAPLAVEESITLPKKKPLLEAKVVADEKAEFDAAAEQVETTKKDTSVLTVDDNDPKELLLLPEDVSLQVAEIFYQEESDKSIALVNDLPVMVGTYVDSAVVVEIRPDTVLFKIEDKIYEVGVTTPE